MRKLILFSLFCFNLTLFAQSWQPLSNAPVGRHHPISFALNGKGYAVTGSLSNGFPTDDMYEYDPVTDSWTQIADFPGQERSFGIGAVNNGLLYMGFGLRVSSFLNDFWSYDANTNTWTQLASCPCSGRRHPAMVALPNKIYVGLGDDITGDVRDWWMYDIPSNSWSQIASLPGPPRHHPYMFSVNNEAFAGLGHSGQTIYKDWYKLDTVNQSWVRVNDFPGEARVAGTQFSLGNKGFVLSGDGDNHSFMATGEMWSYFPPTDTWQQLTPHPGISLWAPGSFVVDNEVYFFGGQNRQNGQFPTHLWKYDLTDEILNVDEVTQKNQVTYPSPAQNEIFWKFDEEVNQVLVYNISGQLVLSKTINRQQLNVSELHNGIYFIQFMNDKKAIGSSKIVIQH